MLLELLRDLAAWGLPTVGLILGFGLYFTGQEPVHTAPRTENAGARNAARQARLRKGRHFAAGSAFDRARGHRRHRQHRRRGAGHLARRRGQHILDVGLRTADGRRQIRGGLQNRSGPPAAGGRRLRRRHDVLSGRRGTARHGHFLLALLHPRRVRRGQPRAVQRHCRRPCGRGREAPVRAPRCWRCCWRS